MPAQPWRRESAAGALHETAMRTALKATAAAAMLALTACVPQSTRPPAPTGAHVAAQAPEQTTILISIDGMPADMLGTGATPTVDAIAAEGVRARWMNPSQPTMTFPNHYTLVTGLRPDRHGIVHNRMTDPELGRFVSKEQASATDGRWWGGEPIWATLQKQGGIAATMFWPGSEARIAGELPRYRRSFDGSVPAQARTDQVLAWLDLPAAQRPRLLTLYFEQYDATAHELGARAPGSMAALRAIDAAIARLREGLRARGLLATTNLVILSDHGMADVPRTQWLWLEDVLDTRHYDVVWWGTFLGLRPKPGQTEIVERAFIDAPAQGDSRRFRCWRRGETPADWHFGQHRRVPPIVCQMNTGWAMLSREQRVPEGEVRGEHGFAMDDATMRSVFVAQGPALCRGVQLAPFENVDIYPLLAHLLQVRPADSDGSLDALRPALRGEASGC